MGRLILAIISTLLEEAAIVAVVLLGLPWLGIHVPLYGLIILMVLWLAYTIATYRLGSWALSKKQLVGLPGMVGSKGEVVSALAPEGLVRIRGELWVARAVGGEMKSGEQVVVVGQDSLKLMVQGSDTDRDSGRS